MIREGQSSFVHNGVVHTYDKVIDMSQLDSDKLILDSDYHFDDHVIPAGTAWDGASSPKTPLARFIAPKYHKNIKASCIHDYLCAKATNSAERRVADGAYFLAKKYIEKDHGLASVIAWAGVRIGAFFGVGSSF